MTIELTIGIPTANRPDSLRACIGSIKNHIDFPTKIVLVDSSSQGLQFKSDKDTEHIEVITPKEMLSPSHARKVIAEHCKTPFLLFIDDDMTVSENSVQTLINFLKQNSDVSIVGGAVDEYGYWREIGFSFLLGEINGTKVVVKDPIRKEWLDQNGFRAFQVDIITQPPFLMRSEIFRKVNFDENYLWASEIYDFFFQCYQNEIISMVLPTSVFYHFPTNYFDTTLKHEKKKYNLQGKEYFYKKWETKIHTLKRPFIYEIINEWKYRNNKKKRVRRKLELDGIQY